MGSCPYCQSITQTGDTICYSCGRVLANLRSKTFAMEQQFNQGTADTAYKMTKKPSARGVIQTHTGRAKNIMKRTRNRSRMLVMVVFIAFVFTSPTVQEASIAKFASIKENILLQASPFHVYPFETTYTITKSIEVSGSEGYLIENLVIPSDVQSFNGSGTQFTYTDGTPALSTVNIQKINQITITVDGQQPIVVPRQGVPERSFEERITTANGHEIWWPGYGSGNDYCSVGACVKIKINLANGQTSDFQYSISLTSTAYSWWDSGRVDSRIEGVEHGINMKNSGTFADIDLRDPTGESQQYKGIKWYDRGLSPVLDSRSLGGWAVDSTHETVVGVSNLISQGLPEGESQNAYGYARAAFDYLHKYATYDKNAPIIARSGVECLEAGTGDCDEQTNAFLALLRVHKLPGWYAFGALTSEKYEVWEGHAWGYIQLPMSEKWCNENNIVLSTCFVQGQVDVVNNKWLLHTPTAYIAWIEQPDSSGDLLNSYYRPGSYTQGIDRSPPAYSTMGEPEFTGGKFKVAKVAENLG
ncbi:MAG: hypothetical protein OSA38_03560 [Candidatus Poseidoniaceae archaeon]|nr:hypothetical protein [Candidatus Poseidoniaceae archaeon]